MSRWAGFSIVILVIVVMAVIGIITIIVLNNKKMKQHGIIYPFSGAINPLKTSDPVNFMTKGGRSQISCPSGMKVNIIGAKVEVADPFGTCSPTPNELYQITCGKQSNSSANITCTSDGECGGGMICAANGTCMPKTCSTSKDCTTGGVQACPTVKATDPNTGKTHEVTAIGVPCNTSDECGGKPMVCVGGTGIRDPSTKDDINKIPWYCYAALGNPITGVLSWILGCPPPWAWKIPGKTLPKSGLCQVDPVLGSCMACRPDDISNPDSGGVCVQAPLCTGLDQNYQNTACKAGGKMGCKPRDVSAYIANICDNKEECDLTGYQTRPLEPSLFGPYPCKKGPGSYEYASLPIVSGWNGLSAADPLAANKHASSFNQGFYLHGIYTCVTNDDQNQE